MKRFQQLNDHDLHIEQLFPGSQLYSMNCDANSNPSFNLPQEFLQKSGKETIDGTDSKFLESKLKTLKTTVMNIFHRSSVVKSRTSHFMILSQMNFY